MIGKPEIISRHLRNEMCKLYLLPLAELLRHFIQVGRQYHQVVGVIQQAFYYC